MVPPSPCPLTQQSKRKNQVPPPFPTLTLARLHSHLSCCVATGFWSVWPHLSAPKFECPNICNFHLFCSRRAGLFNWLHPPSGICPILLDRTRVAWISCSAEFEGPCVSIRSVAALTVKSVLCFCSLIWWSRHNVYCRSQCSWVWLRVKLWFLWDSGKPSSDAWTQQLLMPENMHTGIAIFPDLGLWCHVGRDI